MGAVSVVAFDPLRDKRYQSTRLGRDVDVYEQPPRVFESDMSFSSERQRRKLSERQRHAMQERGRP